MFGVEECPYGLASSKCLCVKSERTVFLFGVEDCSSAMKSERTVFLFGVEDCSSGARLSSCKCMLESTWGALKSERTIFLLSSECWTGVDGAKVLLDGVGVVETGCDGACGDVGT